MAWAEHRGTDVPADEFADLLATPLDELLRQAAAVRDAATGRRITYSPKVFIPLTQLCRDRCGYCTFAQPPARLGSPYLSPDEVLEIARHGADPGGVNQFPQLGAALEPGGESAALALIP